MRSARSRSREGHDVTGYALACFGGAGGQHACKVADALGMETVLVHPLAGMLSAFGIGLAPVKAIREVSLVQPLRASFAEALAALEDEARAVLRDQGIAEDAIAIHPSARLRFAGSDSLLTIACDARQAMDAAFRKLHRQRFAIPIQPPKSSSSAQRPRRAALAGGSGHRHRRAAGRAGRGFRRLRTIPRQRDARERECTPSRC